MEFKVRTFVQAFPGINVHSAQGGGFAFACSLNVLNIANEVTNLIEIVPGWYLEFCTEGGARYVHSYANKMRGRVPEVEQITDRSAFCRRGCCVGEEQTENQDKGGHGPLATRN